MFRTNKRHLCLIAVAFLLGILLAERRTQIWPALALCLTAGLFCSLFCEVPSGGYARPGLRKGWLFLGAILAAATLTGYLQCNSQTQQYQHCTDALCSDVTAKAYGTVYRKEIKANTYAYYLKNSICQIDERRISTGKILVYSKGDSIPIGSQVELTGKIQLFDAAPNEGNFDAAFYYRTQNITCSMFADEMSAGKIPDGGNPIMDGFSWLQEQLYQLQKRISAVYIKHMNERDAGILCQLVLGNKSQMDSSVREQYQSNGIAHILAISGLHISLIGMGIFRFLRRIRRPVLLSCLLSGGLVCCFALMSGFSVSSGRAVLMYLILLGAQLTGRHYDQANALALAALLLLIRNPMALFQSGFLFSFGAILGILLVVPLLTEIWQADVGVNDRNIHDKEKNSETGTKFLKFQKQNLCQKAFCKILVRLCSTAGIQIFLMPLTAWFSFEIPLYGMFLNLLVIPLCGWLLGFGILGGVLGTAGAGLAKWILLLCHGILEIYAQTMRLLEVLPGHLLVTGRPSVWILFMIYLGIAVSLIFRWCHTDRNRMRKSAGLVQRKNSHVVAPVTIILLTGLLFLPHPEVFCVDFLDVGQGDGICITAGSGTHLFLDGGSSSEKQSGSRRILPFLKYHRICRIDAWIVTHGDEDHISGLLELLDNGYPVQKLLLAVAMPQDDAWKRLVTAAKANGTEIVSVTSGMRLQLPGNARMECLYPGMEEADTDRNALSQVWMLEKDSRRILFTGDLGSKQEEQLLQRGQSVTADILKAGHHGSKNSSCEAFLQAVNPKAAVISCGKNNRYGHPHPDTIHRLETVRAKICNTMELHQIRAVWREGEIFLRSPCASKES